MKGGKYGRKRPPVDTSAKGKPGARDTTKRGGDGKPHSDAPKKGARRKPFGGSSSTGEE